MDKKISLPEIIIMVMLAGGADLFGLVAGLALGVPVIGQILIFASLFVSVGVWLIVQFWLIMKGVRGWWYGGGSLFDIFSGGTLPLQSPALWLTIYLANKKETGGIIGTAEKLIKSNRE